MSKQAGIVLHRPQYSEVLIKPLQKLSYSRNAFICWYWTLKGFSSFLCHLFIMLHIHVHLWMQFPHLSITSFFPFPPSSIKKHILQNFMHINACCTQKGIILIFAIAIWSTVALKTTAELLQFPFTFMVDLFLKL